MLSAEELSDLADGGEVSTEDILAVQMAAKANDCGITYVAFTATPKAKTLELFWPVFQNPVTPLSESNLPSTLPCLFDAADKAIREGLILDVLKNYTSYKLAFKLVNNGKEWDEKEVERSENYELDAMGSPSSIQH